MVGDVPALVQVVVQVEPALPVLLAALPPVLLAGVAAGVGTPTGIRPRDQVVVASTGCFPGFSWWSRS